MQAAKQRVSPGAIALLVVLFLGAFVRLSLAFTERGLYWPDEIYQSLEQGHRLAFGYGLIPWEFRDGARNWALPALCAVLLKFFSFFKDSPQVYLAGTHSAFALLGVLAAFGAYRLARVLGASELSGAAAAALFSLNAPAIYFAHRAMSENASAAPVVWGLAFALDPKGDRKRVLFGASLLGLATLLRLQNGVFCVGLLVVLLTAKRWTAARDAGLTLLLWAALFGVVDKLTWGSFFHSAQVYLKFNLVEGKAAQWGTAPFKYYARTLWQSAPWTTVFLLGFGLLGAWKAKALFGVALAFFVLHSFIPHKELRFILPVLPVFAALAALGMERLARWPKLRAAAWVGVALSGVFALFTYKDLRFGQLGQYEDQKPQQTAYDDFGWVNRLLLAAHAQPDVCGLKMEATHIAWTGGLTYLHRDARMYPHFGPGRETGFYNYVLTVQGHQGSGQVLAQDGPGILVKLADGCAPDPGYQPHLP